MNDQIEKIRKPAQRMWSERAGQISIHPIMIAIQTYRWKYANKITVKDVVCILLMISSVRQIQVCFTGAGAPKGSLV